MLLDLIERKRGVDTILMTDTRRLINRRLKQLKQSANGSEYRVVPSQATVKWEAKRTAGRV